MDVRLNPDRIGGNGFPPALSAPEEPMAVSSGGSSPAPRQNASSARSESAEAGSACQWCKAPLPTRDDLNFCPYCGTDVHAVPCSGCGNELDPEWRFCISCGTERPS